MSRRLCPARPIARIAIALFALLAVAGLAQPAAAQSAAEQLTKQLLAPAVQEIEPRHAPVEAAVVAVLNNDLDRAIQLLRQAEEADTRLAPADAMLARLLIIGGNADASRRVIEAAAQASPSDPEAMLLSGQLAMAQQLYTTSEACFLRGLELAEDYEGNAYRQRNLQIMALSGLEAVAAQREQWGVARDYAQRWYDLKPDDLQAMTRLARAMFHQSGQENREQAYKLLGDAYRADATLPRPEISMAQLYASGGEYRRNLIDLAIERDGNTLATRLAACRWALEAADYGFAEENAAAALAIDRTNVEALTLSATAARAQGNMADAERALLQGHELNPADMNITNALAIVLSEQSDAAKQQQAVQYALANFERLQGNYPARADARELAATLAWCQYQAENGQAALEIAVNLARLGSNTVSGDAAYHIAYVLYETNNSRVAREFLVTALASEAPFLRRSEAEALLRKIPPN